MTSSEHMTKRQIYKDLPKDKKLGYLWDYYRWHALAGLILLALLFFLVRDIAAGRRPVSLAGLWINTAAEDAEKAANAYAAKAGAERKELAFSGGLYISPDDGVYSMASLSRAAAMIEAGDLDFLVCDRALAEQMAEWEWTGSLSPLLPEGAEKRAPSRLLSLTANDGTVRVWGVLCEGGKVLCVPEKVPHEEELKRFLAFALEAL